MKRIIGLLLFCIALSACAVGQRYDYGDRGAQLKFTPAPAIGIGVLDNRSYVVNGEKDPTFVGILRAGFGNPWEVRTASEKSLASEFAGTLSNALYQQGAAVKVVDLPKGSQEQAAIQMLAAAGTPRGLLVSISEWKTDTYVGSALHYDVTAKVCDANGSVIGEKRIMGKDDLGSNAWNPKGHAEHEVSKAYRAKLEELLNSAEIARALAP